MHSPFIPIVNHSLTYNPAIDGLRGIAITLVLLFHIWPEFFSFGYVGVDIFFVLSGYLITQILHAKLETNTFSLKEFYRNRIRRIFPAMLIVVLCTFIIGYLFMFPNELQQLGEHIKSSAFFYQNFRLMDEVGYWDEASQLKPLLHFWSLAIEEQFYLIWPVIIWTIYKLRWNFLVSLFSLFILLLIVPQFLKINLFYHSFARFWELCCGGLAYAVIIQVDLKRYKIKAQWYVYLFFIVSVLLSSHNTQFDVYKTLLVVIATGLLIILLSCQSDQKLLSSYPFVFLGLISFPLYLWHYVLISYMHIFGLEVSAYGLVVVGFAIAISYVTYRYIEFYSRKQTNYTFAIFLLMIALSLGFLGQYTDKQKGFPNRSHLESNEKFQSQFIKPRLRDKNGEDLVYNLLGYIPQQSFLRAAKISTPSNTILIAGDSHAYVSYTGFSEEFEKRGFNTLLFGTNSCPLMLGPAIGTDSIQAKRCYERSNEFYALISKAQFSKIILVTRGPKYIYKEGFGIIDNEKTIKNFSFFVNESLSHQKLFYSNLDKTMQYLNTLGSDIYYILENPELGFDPKNCMIRPFRIFENDCKIKYVDYVARMNEYRTNILNLSKQYTNIHILDPQKAFCDNMNCYAIKEGQMLYADDDHLSIDGSRLQSKYLMKQIFTEKFNHAD